MSKPGLRHGRLFALALAPPTRNGREWVGAAEIPGAALSKPTSRPDAIYRATARRRTEHVGSPGTLPRCHALQGSSSVGVTSTIWGKIGLYEWLQHCRPTLSQQAHLPLPIRGRLAVAQQTGGRTMRLGSATVLSITVSSLIPAATPGTNA